MISSQEIAFEVKGLTKIFRTRGALGQTETVHALDGVSFAVLTGKTLGVVGESGSGKSTIGRCVLGLIEPTAGKIALDGQDLNHKRKSLARQFRRQVQIVFQNPQRSFNPLFSIRNSVGEALNLRPDWSREQRQKRVEEVLDAVKIGDEMRDRKPEELSGGQLQRVAVARAIAPEPKLIFLDEPTSSLDLSVRGEILRLLRELQKSLGITYVFVSHDLEVVRVVADNIVVMYHGQIVEQAPARDLFDNPKHPYTQALLAASELSEDQFRWSQRTELNLATDNGCRMRDRCPFAEEKCSESQAFNTVSRFHQVRCWKVTEYKQPIGSNKINKTITDE